MNSRDDVAVAVDVEQNIEEPAENAASYAHDFAQALYAAFELCSQHVEALLRTSRFDEPSRVTLLLSKNVV